MSFSRDRDAIIRRQLVLFVAHTAIDAPSFEEESKQAKDRHAREMQNRMNESKHGNNHPSHSNASIHHPSGKRK